jgi:translation initiation factor IF-3
LINKQNKILNYKVNREIKSESVRVINQNGEDLGQMSLYDAFNVAEFAGLDLVEVSSAQNISICKIMDYMKEEYEAQKKQKRIKKNSRVVSLKEIRLTARIDDHDYDVKMKHAKRFLEEDKDKVSVSIIFRGRELDYKDIAYRIVNRVKQDLSEIGKLDSEPKLDRKRMIMIFSPLIPKK